MSSPFAPDALFRTFFEFAPDLMCIMGRDGCLLYVNRVVEAFGYAADDLISLPLLELLHPEDRAAMVAELAKLGEGSRLVGHANRCRCKDGSYRWLSWSARAASGGQVFAVARDVTDAKRAEASLQQAHRFLDAIVENIPNMVFVKDADRLAFVRFNRAGEALLGVPRAELLGKNDYDFFPEEEAAFFQTKDRETLKAGKLVEIPEEPIQTARGLRLLRTKKVPITDADGTPRYLLGISEDITEYKAGEEARARLASIVADSTDAIIGRTLDGEVTSWNRSAERMFGYSAQEMLGQPISILFPERLRDEERSITERCEKGERVEPYETVRRCQDGREIEVSVATSPVLDSSGRTTGISTIVRDITELKRTQRQLVRAKDATEAANRELDAFSHSVAHDLRAPLRSIDGFSHAVVEDYGHLLDAQGRKYLGFVREAAQNMAQLIDDMLVLSRV
ncbi:MAG TPA: PAS domain S-box protein, partial [Polyangiaceae bacterium]|nr:PAS domain S-box protein [Polyangiaceae bacterium]